MTENHTTTREILPTINTLRRFQESGLEVHQLGNDLLTPRTEGAVDIALDHDWNWWEFSHEDGGLWMHVNKVFNREE